MHFIDYQIISLTIIQVIVVKCPQLVYIVRMLATYLHLVTEENLTDSRKRPRCFWSFLKCSDSLLNHH